MLVDGDFTWWRGATFLTEVDASASRATWDRSTRIRRCWPWTGRGLQSRDGRGAHEVSSFNSASGRRIRRPPFLLRDHEGIELCARLRQRIDPPIEQLLLD